MTQLEQVENHLYDKGQLTSWDAITLYHITRLSEYIRVLRHEKKMKIDDVWETNNGKAYKRYLFKPPEQTELGL